MGPEAPSELGPSDQPAEWVTPPGAQIGRFVVIRLVGTGAMGAVYEARDPQLNRSIALKLLKRNDANHGVRFLREAEALARLSHPNVVTVHDVGAAGEKLFIAMEYVDGVTLDLFLGGRRHGWRELLGLFVQAGRGLAAAHARSIIHRDFKPSNVIVDREGRVRVTDFGLARLAEPSGTPASGATAAALDEASTAPPDEVSPSPPVATMLEVPLTQVGCAVGTPRYMAPEQRDRGIASIKSDQYSFCVAFWEALFHQHPRERNAGRTPRGAPRWLAAALEIGLAPDPDRRHPSMTALISLLERTPVRRRTMAWAGLAVLLVGGAATGAVLLGSREAAPRPCADTRALLAGAWDDAVREKLRTAFAQSGRVGAGEAYRRVASILDAYAAAWTVMRTEACEATEIRHEQSAQLLDLRMYCFGERLAEVRALTQVLTERPEPRAVENAVKLALGLSPIRGCGDAPALLSKVPPPGDPDLRVRVEELRLRVYVADTRGKIGSAPAALAMATEAAQAARVTGYAPLIAHALEVRGHWESRTSGTKTAEATFKEAVQVAAESREDTRVATIWLALMDALAQNPDRRDDALALEPVVRAALARAGADPGLRFQLPFLLGNVLREKGKLEEAGRQYREALALLDKDNSTHLVRRAILLNSMANLYHRQGRNEDAVAAYEEARAAYVKTQGPETAGVPTTLTNQAHALIDLDRCEEAVGHGEHGMGFAERVYGADSIRLLIDHAVLGGAYACIRDEAAARAHFTRALVLAEREGAETLRVAEALESFGSGLNDLGQYAEAIPHLNRALAIRETKGDKRSAGITSSLLAEAHLATGKSAAARRLSQRAVAALEHGEVATDLAVALHGLARAELATARPADAVAPAERALALTQGLQWRPSFEAHAKLTLAKALWDSRRDRDRAVGLAREAESIYARKGSSAAREREAAAAWLRGRASAR